MHRHRTLLGVDTRSKHRSRTENDADVSTIHRFYHRFFGFLVLALLNKAYLVRRDMIIFYQFTLHLRIDIKVSAGLVSTQVREHKLRTLLCIILLIVVIK